MMGFAWGIYGLRPDSPAGRAMDEWVGRAIFAEARVERLRDALEDICMTREVSWIWHMAEDALTAKEGGVSGRNVEHHHLSIARQH
jgi:hypothetical protein